MADIGLLGWTVLETKSRRAVHIAGANFMGHWLMASSAAHHDCRNLRTCRDAVWYDVGDDLSIPEHPQSIFKAPNTTLWLARKVHALVQQTHLGVLQ